MLNSHPGHISIIFVGFLVTKGRKDEERLDLKVSGLYSSLRWARQYVVMRRKMSHRLLLSIERWVEPLMIRLQSNACVKSAFWIMTEFKNEYLSHNNQIIIITHWALPVCGGVPSLFVSAACAIKCGVIYFRCGKWCDCMLFLQGCFGFFFFFFTLSAQDKSRSKGKNTTKKP